MQETRSQQIGLRVTPSERAQLAARADAAGMSITTFLIRSALGALPEAAKEADRVAELAEQLADVDRRLSAIEELAGR